MAKIMRKATAMLLAFSMLASLLVTTTYAVNDAFKSSATTVSANDTFIVSFTYPVSQTVASIKGNLTFNKDAFEIISIAQIPNMAVQPDVSGSNNDGTITLNIASPKTEADISISQGTKILEVTFKAKSNASANNYTFELNNFVVRGGTEDEYGVFEDITPTDAIGSKTLSITIKAPATELSSTLTLSAPVTPVYGDTANPAITAPEHTTAELKWYEESSTTEFTGTFKELTHYNCVIIIRADEGYEFADDTTFVVGTNSSWTKEKLSDGRYKLTNQYYTSAHIHIGGSATCIQQAICTICNQPYGNYAPHSYTAATLTSDALKTSGNCQTKAVYYYSCSVCGAVERNDDHVFSGETNPSIHTGQKVYVSTDAHTHTQKWSCCSAVISTESHSWKSGTCTKCQRICSHTGGTPSCTEKATCEICGEKYGNTVPHNYSDTYLKDNADSDKHYHVCSNCNAKDAGEKHTPGPAATETTPQTCTVCGYVLQSALGHQCKLHLDKVPRKEPTCTEPGNKEYYKCSDSSCGKYYEDPNAVTEITDHNSVILNPAHKMSTTWSFDGSKHWHECSVCSHKEDESSHTGGSATCTQQAICTICNQPYGDCTPHSFTVYTLPIKDESGFYYQQRKCANCDERDTGSDGAFKAYVTIETKLNINTASDSAGNPTKNPGFKFSIIAKNNSGDTVIAPGIPFEGFVANKATQTLVGKYNFEVEGATLDDVKTSLAAQLSDVTNENYWLVKQVVPDNIGTEWTVDKAEFMVYFNGYTVVTKTVPTDPMLDPQVADILFNNTYKSVKQDDPPTPTPVIPEGPKHTNRRYPAKPAASTDTKKPDGVNSARTFDAGVALYVGMSVLSLTGTALVIGKKKEF